MQLLSQKERNEFVFEDSKFFYRRINVNEMEILRKKHTVRGELNAIPFGIDVTEAGMLDWDGIVDEAGKPVKYSKELITQLPASVISTLANLITGGSGEVEKNW